MKTIHQYDANRFARRSQQGFTLIEVLLVLVLLSALLSATIGLISIAGASQRSSKGGLSQRQEIRRFAGDLRRDVRESETSSIASDSLVLTDDSNETRTEYQIESESTVSRAVITKEGATQSNDLYRFEPAAKIEMKRLKKSETVQWVITSDRPAESPFEILASRRSSK